MYKKLSIEEIKSYFSNQKIFSKDMIMGYFKEKNENLSFSNLNVRINRLKSKGVIIQVGKGWYSFNHKRIFDPVISKTSRKIGNKIKKEFPYLNFILWSTDWLNELATLQLMRNLVIIEVESGSEDAVFRTIKESFPNNTFFNPKEYEWEYYIHGRENLIIKTMISESPYNNAHSIKIARLEKILVDIYCDKMLQFIFSSEMYNMFNEVCTNYSINYTTLLSYAGRRGRKNEIWEYIKALKVIDPLTIEMIEK